MIDVNAYVQSEIKTLSDFIYEDCIDEPEKENKMRYAVKKTIESILANILVVQEIELSKIKEEYYTKLISDQQKIMNQFSGILDKAMSALISK